MQLVNPSFLNQLGTLQSGWVVPNRTYQKVRCASYQLFMLDNIPGLYAFHTCQQYLAYQGPKIWI